MLPSYHLLPEHYDEFNSMYVRSTDFNRTLMSARVTVIFGLYPLGTGTCHFAWRLSTYSNSYRAQKKVMICLLPYFMIKANTHDAMAN